MYEPDAVLTALRLLPEDETAKRPPNAFILFCRSLRPSIRTENPDLPDVELNRTLAKLWQMADEPTRVFYREHAKTLREEYRGSHADCDPEHSKKSASRAIVKEPQPIRLRVILQEELPADLYA
jgi:hypothetical protein